MKKPIKNSVSVDCSCIGNPGITEYRCIDNLTGEILFEKNIGLATNNIGEFLAVVHFLAYNKDKPLRVLYTDSQTALSWVRRKRFKTTLEKNTQTQTAWTLLLRAEKWLKENDNKRVQILKWETKYWGEISADYGRKGNSYQYSMSPTEREANENMILGLKKIDLQD